MESVRKEVQEVSEGVLGAHRFAALSSSLKGPPLSKNQDIRRAQQTTKLIRTSVRRDAHEQMLTQHDHHCGHLRLDGRPVSRVDVYRAAVSV